MDGRTDGQGWYRLVLGSHAVGGPLTAQGGSRPRGTLGDSPQEYTRTCWGVLGAPTALSGSRRGASADAPKGPGGASAAVPGGSEGGRHPGLCLRILRTTCHCTPTLWGSLEAAAATPRGCWAMVVRGASVTVHGSTPVSLKALGCSHLEDHSRVSPEPEMPQYCHWGQGHQLQQSPG